MAAATSPAAYKLVADTLRKRILGGELSPGERLPTERELCDQFAASRITIRRALQILADEILIQRRHGSGTYVSPSPSRRIPILSTDFSGSMAAHAPELTRRLESWQWLRATDDVAASLQVQAGSRVLFARRIDELDEKPVAFDEVYLVERSADRLDKQDLGQLRFLEQWQTAQRISLNYLTQIIEAVAAESSHCQHLGCKVGTPLLKEIDTIFLTSGEACGLFISYYCNDLFRLISTIRLEASGGGPTPAPVLPQTESAGRSPGRPRGRKKR